MWDRLVVEAELVRPSPVVVNAKSCGPFGNVSFTIVKDAWLCVLVNVHVTSTPATRSTVATPVLRSVAPPACRRGR